MTSLQQKHGEQEIAYNEIFFLLFLLIFFLILIPSSLAIGLSGSIGSRTAVIDAGSNITFNYAFSHDADKETKYTANVDAPEIQEYIILDQTHFQLKTYEIGRVTITISLPDTASPGIYSYQFKVTEIPEQTSGMITTTSAGDMKEIIIPSKTGYPLAWLERRGMILNVRNLGRKELTNTRAIAKIFQEDMLLGGFESKPITIPAMETRQIKLLDLPFWNLKKGEYSVEGQVLSTEARPASFNRTFTEGMPEIRAKALRKITTMERAIPIEIEIKWNAPAELQSLRLEIPGIFYGAVKNTIFNPGKNQINFENRRMRFEPKNHTAMLSYVYEKKKYEKQINIEVEEAPKIPETTTIMQQTKRPILSEKLKITLVIMMFMIFGFCILTAAYKPPINKNKKQKNS